MGKSYGLFLHVFFGISPHHNFVLKCCNNNCIFIWLIPTVFSMVSHHIIFLNKIFITVLISIDFLPLVHSLILLLSEISQKPFLQRLHLYGFSPACISSCCFTFSFCVRTLL